MKALTIRDIPDKTYQLLTTMAHEHGRSLQSEMRILIEKECFLYKEPFSNQVKKWHTKLQKRNWGDLTQEIRNDRETR